MDSTKVTLLLHTVKHLRFKQVYYRLYYIIRNRYFPRQNYRALQKEVEQPKWGKQEVLSADSYESDSFKFLNLKQEFKGGIDWNFFDYGKLWTYNLNYFDFLNQSQISKDDGISLIIDYIEKDKNLKDGKEPYPISLRGINWVKFLSKNEINSAEINAILFRDYQILLSNLEYHLLGNHLLENGFSLFFGAYYFQDEDLYKKAINILSEELEEQILIDGAHFELSPMYHQILLHRVLDCVNLVKQNKWKNQEILSFLEKKAEKMLSWLSTITYSNGAIPMVNDCAYGIAPSSEELFQYANALKLKWKRSICLSDSGYRKFNKEKYELFVDVGNIGPKYQPGHAHSDTFNFELHIGGNPIIVDTGTSTYEKNTVRQKERATEAHNTVKIGTKDQSEVWGGFRVGRRAKIVSIKESTNVISAEHSGYKKIGVLHKRSFSIDEDKILIVDKISKNINDTQIAFFHFHPNVKNVIVKDFSIELAKENTTICFDGKIDKISSEGYQYPLGFNKTLKAIMVKVYFKTDLNTAIVL